MVCSAYLFGYENKVASNLEKPVENRNLQDLITEVRVPTETVTESNMITKRAKWSADFPRLCAGENGPYG